MYISRRLFPLPVIIASYSSDQLKSGRRKAGYAKLRGWRCILKTQKPVTSTYNLHIPTGDCMLFLVLGAQLKFFLAKTWPENAVGMFSTQVGALFRKKGFAGGKNTCKLLMISSFRRVTPDPIRGGIQAFYQLIDFKAKDTGRRPGFHRGDAPG